MKEDAVVVPGVACVAVSAAASEPRGASELPELLHAIFGFEDRAPSNWQTGAGTYFPLFREFAETSEWARNQPAADKAALVRAAALTTRSDNCVAFYESYGCVLVARSEIDAVVLQLIAPDEWRFGVHAGPSRSFDSRAGDEAAVLHLDECPVQDWAAAQQRASPPLRQRASESMEI